MTDVCQIKKQVVLWLVHFCCIGILFAQAPISLVERDRRTPKLVPIQARVPSPPMVFDIENRTHTFFGFGMGIHPSDVNHRELLNELDVDFVRMEVGPFWNELDEKIPTSADDAAMDDYILRNFNADSSLRLDGAKWAFKVLAELDVKTVLVNFEMPYHWLTDDRWRTLKDTHVDDLVRFWASLLLRLKEEGMYPDYVELANEPDGAWNGNIPPHLYRRVVRLAREEFDRRGLSHVKILGPGLAFLHQGKAWIDALSPDAVDSLHGWSTHIWDEVNFPKSRPEYVYGIWKPFLQSIADKGLGHRKPIFVTEFSTDVTNYYGKIFSSPRHGIENAASDSIEFAIRSIVNSIMFINRGANAVFYYRFSDQFNDETFWGILRNSKSGGGIRPVFDALKSVFPYIPDWAEVLKPTWYHHDDSLNAAAFYKDNQLTIVMVNHTLDTISRLLIIKGMPHGLSVSGRGYVQGQLAVICPTLQEVEEGRTEVEVVLFPESTQTLTFDAQVLQQEHVVSSEKRADEREIIE